MEMLTIQGQKYNIYDVNDFPYKIVSYHLKNKNNILKSKKEKGTHYFRDFATFDTESTTIDESVYNDKKKRKIARGFAILYSWQYCINTNKTYYICNGRDCDSMKEFFKRLEKQLFCNGNYKIVTYVHNLSYDFQFFKDVLEVDHIFAKDSRKVMKCNAMFNHEMRCSYFLSNMSLAKFAESEQVDTLKEKKIDYTKIRLPDTPLTQKEKIYNNADCIALHKSIKHLMDFYGDSIRSIPLTSTGYVRREYRRNMDTPKNHKLIEKCTPNEEIYKMLKDAFRGGNTVANRHKIGKILNNVYSYDIQSSYPYVLMSKYFPMSPFKELKTFENLGYFLQNYCCLMRVTFSNLRTDNCAPYLPVSKCILPKNENGQPKKYINCNGRILYAEKATTTITEIDLQIISKTYTFDNINIEKLFFAERGQLPQEFKDKLMELYTKKTELKDVEGQEYFYNKAKNKVNSSYGMTVTDITQDEIFYQDGIFTKEKITDIQKALDKYRKSKNSFLLYQWGIWCTSHARNQLQKAIDATDADKQNSSFIYSDTDSVKFTDKKIIDRLEKLNSEIIEEDEEKGYYAKDKKGKKRYLGIYEKEHDIDKFKTYGAKKYACVIGDKFIPTVSGCGKKELAQVLKNDINNFSITGVPWENVGRTTACYNDLKEPEEREINGKTYKVYSNVGIIENTYKLGITDELTKLLEYIE